MTRAKDVTHSRHYMKRWGKQYLRLQTLDALKVMTPEDQQFIKDNLTLALGNK